MIDKDKLNKYISEGYIVKQTHPTLPLSIYNYSQKTQFEKFWNPTTLMARGLILDDNYNIAARGFPKFFNYEEKRHTATDKWSVYNKADGSLGIIFLYDGQEVIATRGSFTSEQAIKAKEIFNETCCGIGHYDVELKPNWSYLVEIIYPSNRVVVSYSDEKLVLLGAYNGLEEVDYDDLPDWPHKIECYGQADFLELQKEDLENAEGYVVKFSNGDRCKVKFETYIKLHRIMTGFSSKAVFECLKNGKDLHEVLKDTPDEFYANIKEFADNLKTEYGKIHQYAMQVYNAIGHIANRKKFAEQALSTDIPDILFKMKDGKEFSDLIWKRIEPPFEKLS